MEQTLTGKILSPSSLKSKEFKTPFEEEYGDYFLYHIGGYAARVAVGGMWITIWIAITLTLIRYTRGIFKIKWTRADEMQMYDYYETSTMIRFFVFLILWMIVTFLFTISDFGRESINYGLIFGAIYSTIQLLYLLKDTMSRKVEEPAGKIKTE